MVFIEKAILKELPDRYHYILSNRIADELADSIEKLLGFSVKGYKNKITPGHIRHIIKRHGVNGISDQSMAEISEIAKIGYVIENYNKVTKGNDVSVEFKNKDGSPSSTIVIQTDVGKEYYYVVEAVPDSARKTMFVITAYKNKKDTNAEVGDAESLNPDVQNALQSNVSSNIIITKDK